MSDVLQAPTSKHAWRMKTLADSLVPAALVPLRGRVTAVNDVVLHADYKGMGLGQICQIERLNKAPLRAKVIGFEGTKVILSPFGSTAGIVANAHVTATRDVLTLWVGQVLLGRVIDPFGQSLDGKSASPSSLQDKAIAANPPSPMSRPLIAKPLMTGLRVIDGPLTVGHGQRIGIFGPPGTGKSTLLAAIAKHSDVEVVVIAMVGERGREVREFLERDLPEDKRKNVVAVVSTSDRPAVERAICAQSATAVAEFFQDQGLSVLLLVDSLTRTARALREIGLAAGEAPTRRGFPASVYPALPALIERAGRSEKGDITAFYTVLLEGKDDSDPIAEEVKSLTDGHFVLSRDHADKGQYPAIDVLQSISRSMPSVVAAGHMDVARQAREVLARYEDVELLIQVGEYKVGSDPAIDRAIASKPKIDAFLRQSNEPVQDLVQTVAALREAVQ